MVPYLALVFCLPHMVSVARVKISEVVANLNNQKQTHMGLKSEIPNESSVDRKFVKPWADESRPDSLVQTDEWPNWFSKPEEPCLREYSVEFKLGDMHSYFTVPTCARTRPRWQMRLDRCGKCDTGNDAGAEIHWNIPDCTRALCLWPKGSFGDADTIGPPEGIKMHPKCAWGIIGEMNEVYKSPWRAAGLGGVFQALGGESWNPVNWGKVLGAGITGGMQNLASKAAETVNWEKRLNLDCRNARSREEVLKKNPVVVNEKNGSRTVEPIGAVCWNNVIDFRDLWCYWKDRLDVTSEGDCDRAFSSGRFVELPTTTTTQAETIEAKSLFTLGDSFLWQYKNKNIKCCTSTVGKPTRLQDMKAEELPAERSFGSPTGCGYMFGDSYHNGLKGYQGNAPSCPVSVPILMEITGKDYESIRSFLEASD